MGNTLTIECLSLHDHEPNEDLLALPLVTDRKQIQLTKAAVYFASFLNSIKYKQYLSLWTAVHQQTRRWIRAGCFEAMAHDLRMLLRELSERASQPTTVILEGRSVQSTPESGARADYDGHKRRKGSKGAHRVGYARAFAGSESYRSQRTRTRSSRSTRPMGAGGHQRTCPSRLFGSGLHGPGACRRCRTRRNPLDRRHYRKQNAALSSCHAVGWSNAPLHARPASVVSPAITNGSHPHSPTLTGSLPSSSKVHDTL